MNTEKRLSPLMRAVRTFHTAVSEDEEFTQRQLEHQRKEMDLFANLAVSDAGIARKTFHINYIPCEIIRPKDNIHLGKIVLYCHGGGFTCGNLSYSRVLGIKIARAAGIHTLIYAYRLAPEYRYPAPLEDTRTVWRYLRMQEGYAAEDIFLAGDSAGGNIASLFALELIKKGEKPAGLILFSPFTDMSLSSDSYNEWKNFDPVLTKDYIEHIRRVYLGENVTDFANPSYSPLFADLSGMPPVLIQAGTHEILRGDSERFALELKKSGCHTKLHVYEDGWHVFQQMPIPLAAEAMSEVGKFINLVVKRNENEL